MKITYTLNGGIAFEDSGNKNLNFFAMGPTAKDDETLNLFIQAYNAQPTAALRLACWLGDIRGGQGFRDKRRNILRWLKNNNSEDLYQNLNNFIEFFRFDDFYRMDKEWDLQIASIFYHNLMDDYDSMSNKRSVSLLAKWMPSENTSSNKTRGYAKKFLEITGLSSTNYRKILSALRQYIDVVEKKMSANMWGEIDYEKVPSKAANRYKKTFIKHDPKRYSKFLEDVKSGDAEIKADTLWPHELVREYRNSFRYNMWDHIDIIQNPTVEAQWKALPDYLKGKSVLCVVDGSGSMQASAGHESKYGVSCLDVAFALGIYTAQRNKGVFKNLIIPFSSHAKFVRFDGDGLAGPLSKVISEVNEVANTNFFSVFELILGRAVQFNAKQDDLPETILVITDGQFDAMVNQGSQTVLDVWKRKFEEKGYKVPKVIFWNVNSYLNMPARAKDKDVVMIAGFSPTILKAALSIDPENFTPINMLLDIINSERYKTVISIKDLK